MRAALVVAAICLFGATQSGLAAPLVIKLSRPNTSYSTFLNDRNACLNGTSSAQWDRMASPSASAILWRSYNARAFASCMNAKGYLLDPNGYRAIRYQKDDGGHEWVEPL